MADTLDIASAASPPVPFMDAGRLPPDTSQSIAKAAEDKEGRIYRSITRDARTALDAKIGADAAAERQREDKEKQYNDRMEKMIAAEGASLDELKNPWKPEEHQQQTGLWESFGSPGFLVAMMGSAFSAMPMNSALAAGGAALDAIHRSDNAAYEKAYKAWKDNTQLTLDRLKAIERSQNSGANEGDDAAPCGRCGNPIAGYSVGEVERSAADADGDGDENADPESGRRVKIGHLGFLWL